MVGSSPMDAATARSLAHAALAQQRDAAGMPVLDRVERVASRVPDDARPVAFLHELLERTDVTVDDLVAAGAEPADLAALALLTAHPGESFELQVLAVAFAHGPEGRIAREVAIADLDDHLAEPDPLRSSPPYGWARHHIAFARRRLGEDAVPGPPRLATGT
jgi:hypothetical protein